MLLIPMTDFFHRLSKDFRLLKKSKTLPNLANFLCLDPVRFPEYILVNKFCKALEFFMGNACLKSLGIIVSIIAIIFLQKHQIFIRELDEADAELAKKLKSLTIEKLPQQNIEPKYNRNENDKNHESPCC
jgi:hypothetical protein